MCISRIYSNHSFVSELTFIFRRSFKFLLLTTPKWFVICILRKKFSRFYGYEGRLQISNTIIINLYDMISLLVVIYLAFWVFVYNLIRLGSATDKIRNLITVELMACKEQFLVKERLIRTLVTRATFWFVFGCWFIVELKKVPIKLWL